MAVLFYFQFRSIADLGRSSSVVLSQRSQETADGLAQDAEDGLKSAYISVGLRVGQRQLEPLDLPFIKNAFADGYIAAPFIARMS